jgi:heme oxygenase
MMQANEHSGSILHRLKTTTAHVHRRVEERLDIFSAKFNLARYVLLLQRFHGFWAPIEVHLQHVPELCDPALALNERLKAHLLEADLRAFHIDPAHVVQCTHLPHLRSFGQALGCMYVLEGSTLGSQIIARHLTERFQRDSGSVAAFFNAYGGAIGARWAEFRYFLTSHTEASSADELLGAAIETFELLDSWLAAGRRC